MCPTINAMLLVGVIALIVAYQINPKYIRGITGTKKEGLLIQCGGPSSDYIKSQQRVEDLNLKWYPQAAVRFLEDTL